jgi:hypothetical protein
MTICRKGAAFRFVLCAEGHHFSMGNPTMLPHSVQDPSYTFVRGYPRRYRAVNHPREPRWLRRQ